MTTWTAVVVLVGTAVAMPLVRRELVRRQLLDHPNLRSSHEVPAPRGGGIGVLVGLVLGAVVLTLAGGGRPPATGAVAAVASGALVLALVGWLDDVRGLGAAPRLAAQVLVGLGVGGLVADGPPSLWYAVFGALALPVAVNAVNFMDGIDGITGATMVVWGATLVFAGWRHGQPEVAAMAVRRPVLDLALPLPRQARWCAYDYWLVVLAERYLRVTLVPEQLMLYRRHGANASGGGSRSGNSLAHRVIVRVYCLAALTVRGWRRGLSPRWRLSGRPGP